MTRSCFHGGEKRKKKEGGKSYSSHDVGYALLRSGVDGRTDVVRRRDGVGHAAKGERNVDGRVAGDGEHFPVRIGIGDHRVDCHCIRGGDEDLEGNYSVLARRVIKVRRKQERALPAKCQCR